MTEQLINGTRMGFLTLFMFDCLENICRMRPKMNVPCCLLVFSESGKIHVSIMSNDLDRASYRNVTIKGLLSSRGERGVGHCNNMSLCPHKWMFVA